jgi:nickel superoxide dismutase
MGHFMNHNFLKTLLLFSLLIGTLFAHCQVPCGIYNDAVRIVQIQEDYKTIQKAMLKIQELSEKRDALSLNQITRWVMTKENHASKIQHTISDYFLSQRIKMAMKDSEDDLYLKQITVLHQNLVLAMKCKQTVEQDHAHQGLELLNVFVDLYFDEHGRDHINKLTQQ